MSIPVLIVIVILVNWIFSLRRMAKQNGKGGEEQNGITASAKCDQKGSVDSTSG